MSARRVGLSLLGVALVVGVVGPWVAPNPPNRQFRSHLYAPPMTVRVIDEQGTVRRPFVYSLELVDRMERRFEENRAVPHTLTWFRAGTLVQLDLRAPDRCCSWGRTSSDETCSPDFSGGRSGLAGCRDWRGAGGAACSAPSGAEPPLSLGGWVDELLMRLADFVLVSCRPCMSSSPFGPSPRSCSRHSRSS